MRPRLLVFASLSLLGSFLLGHLATGQGGPPGEHRAQAVASPATVAVVLEGFVLAPDGSPAEGAVVVSSAGGRAVTDVAGNYRLEVEVPLDASSVQVTAVGSAGGSLVASASVALNSATGSTRVDPLALTSGSSCSPSWMPTFGGQPGTNDFVSALAVYDDGGGPALYAGGRFTSAGGEAANRIAKWDGTSWAALGSGMNRDVYALAVYDDGNGPALYAGGVFTSAGGVTANRIARWDGASWAKLDMGMNTGQGAVYALVVHDDGSGPALYAGGSFQNAGGVTVNNIARWDGSSWSALGIGTSDTVRALAVYDDGSGPRASSRGRGPHVARALRPALYAAGRFTTAGGTAANRIAKWDGSSWSAVGSGLSNDPPALTPVVRALAVYDDGGGQALCAAGEFNNAGGVPAMGIAKWDGSTWSALGSGVNAVFSLAAYDDGAGPALYAAGSFAWAGGVMASRIAKWDGSSWSPFGGGITAGANGNNPEVDALCVHDDGSGPALYAGGNFKDAGGTLANSVAKWDGSSWAALWRGINNGVCALAAYDDGGGRALYSGGDFTRAGGVPVSYIAKWDGSNWSPLGTGMDSGTVKALVVHDDGSGPALYAGGSFTTAGGVAANSIARWDGSNWTALGTGMNGYVSALAVYDDGSGPALYAGGQFTSAGGVSASRIAKWNGASWSPLGTGANNLVLSLAVYDDGGGPALFAGGALTLVGGVAANRIARWNGASWSPLGSGTNADVHSVAVYDDGGGPALFAGGVFTLAGGVAVNRIAKWNGSSWSPLGSGMSAVVHSLVVHDAGDGPALFAGGNFTTAGGLAVNRIGKWDGANWSSLESGVNASVLALTVHDDGGGPALFAGGEFDSAFDSGDSYLAKWGCDSVPPTISCPPSVLVPDRFGSSPGEVVSFSVTASDEVDPSPTVVCVPPSGSFFPRGTTLVTCTATDASGNQSTCQFEVTVAPKARRR